MLTADLHELLSDADRHTQREITVFEYKENKVRVYSGGMMARNSSKGLFLGTADTGYYVGQEHRVVKENGFAEQGTVHYRVLQEDVEILNIVFSH